MTTTVQETKLLNVLCSTCENVTSTLDYPEALKSIVENAAHCLKTKASSIRLLDRTGTMLETAATFGLSEAYLKKGPVKISMSPLDSLVLSGRVIQIKDVTTDKQFQYGQEAQIEGIKSVLCLPLKSRERFLGVLRVYTGEEHIFNEDEIVFIRTFAAQASSVIKNAQQYRRLKMLNELGRDIVSHLEIKKVLETICTKALEDMSAHGASVIFVDSKGKLELAATAGLSERFLNAGAVKTDESIQECLKGRESVIEDAQTDPRLGSHEAFKDEGIKSILCIPFEQKGRAIGTLRLYTAYRYTHDQEDTDFLKILRDFGVIALENARRYEHIRRDYEDLSRDVWNWYGWGTRQPTL
jgi:signal transduction protein with GAF and PtsI domain